MGSFVRMMPQPTWTTWQDTGMMTSQLGHFFSMPMHLKRADAVASTSREGQLPTRPPIAAAAHASLRNSISTLNFPRNRSRSLGRREIQSKTICHGMNIQ